MPLGRERSDDLIQNYNRDLGKLDAIPAILTNDAPRSRKQSIHTIERRFLIPDIVGQTLRGKVIFSRINSIENSSPFSFSSADRCALTRSVSAAVWGAPITLIVSPVQFKMIAGLPADSTT